MAFISSVLIFATVYIFKTDCQQQGFLAGVNNPYTRSLLQSMASQVPALSQKAAAGSNLPAVETPQVLLNAFKMASPSGTSYSPGAASSPGAAPAPSPLNNQMGTYGGTGTGNQATASNQGTQQPLPVTPGTKLIVSRWANQLGHKAYYEAHGCVDPTTTLLGEPARFASIALMMGCNSFPANEICDMAQTAHVGPQGGHMRTMMDMMMDKTTKHMLEECLTPSTFMNGIDSMMGSKQQTAPTAPGYAASPAAGSQTKTPVDCSGVSQMLMVSSAAEGLLNPEILEQIGTMRNRYLKMTCQENLILGSLPYRLCCPGHVKAPTMQEAMMMRSMGTM